MDPSTSRNSVLYGGQNVASKGQNWNRSGTADISKWQHVVMKEEKTDLFRFFFFILRFNTSSPPRRFLGAELTSPIS